MTTAVDTSKMFVGGDQVKAYADYRPQYSDEIFQFIVSYCKETMPNLNMCVDVGCGSGQSTVGFAKHFKKVIGVDISQSQIESAPKNLPNVQFRVSSAETLPFVESKSVDLWCSAQSFCYMPQELTFKEADRVLKPGGTMAIFGYSFLWSTEKPINDVLKALFYKLYSYCQPKSLPLFEKFSDVKLPYPGWFRNDKLKITQKFTLRDYIGLVGSMYSSVAYREANPQEDFIGDVERSMRAALDQVYGPNKDVSFEVVYDNFIIIGRKPLE